ncbi:MAG: dynamin family protein [Litoreibacter sp.]|nr:dynamin family protein [Litoreibacter sp.]MCY4335996.1 dynamin family protein [Litoreibacter sp.]
MTEAARKPRIALMGEFSAGKSTLSNLLLGSRPLPEKVNATRLSPVWMSHGTDAAYREDVSGTQEPVSIEALEGIDVETTKVIRLFFEADILQVCDLIDFPGISDPNMSSEVWQRMLGEVDAVLWCTHATQAWRQSESAVWDTIPEAVRDRSVLLVTKYDKLTTERDEFRVVARLKKETEGKFGAIFPISLTAAIAAGEDYEAFDASGGGAFLEHLIPLIDELNGTVSGMTKSLFAASSPNQHDAADAPAPTSDAQAESPVPTPEPAVAREPMTAFAQAVAQPTESATSQENPVVTAEPATLAGESPAVEVPTSKPVLQVESDQPVAAPAAAPVDAMDERVLPKRVRPVGSGTRRPVRPTAKGQVLSMDKASDMAPPERPRSTQATQLRSFFVGEADGASHS